MRTLFAIAAAVLASSCVSVLPEGRAPAARYEIADVKADVAAQAPVTWTLAVDEPDATLAFNTAKIALSRAPSQIEYYAGGEWVDRAPRLFGAALVRSFENTGRIVGVGSRQTLPSSNYILQTDIRKFVIDHNAGPLSANVSVFARLVTKRGEIAASRLFWASEEVSSDNANASAEALGRAAIRIEGEIVQWTFEAAAKAEAAKTQ
ncbi:MAG: ABC-type transport auxiliary lipoprotein family protein [Parvularculaceae bacterium]